MTVSTTLAISIFRITFPVAPANVWNGKANGNMDKTNLSMTLPKVGDKLFRIMSRGRYDPGDVYNPEPCTVEYVNEKKGNMIWKKTLKR